MKSSSPIGFCIFNTNSCLTKFLTKLKRRSSSCNFQEQDRMMRDKIVFTLTGKLQELLLTVDGLTLEKAVNVCRAYESTKQVKEFKDK